MLGSETRKLCLPWRRNLDQFSLHVLPPLNRILLNVAAGWESGRMESGQLWPISCLLFQISPRNLKRDEKCLLRAPCNQIIMSKFLWQKSRLSMIWDMPLSIAHFPQLFPSAFLQKAIPNYSQSPMQARVFHCPCAISSGWRTFFLPTWWVHICYCCITSGHRHKNVKQHTFIISQLISVSSLGMA